MTIILALLVVACAVGAVVIRTFWDLKVKSQPSHRVVVVLRTALVVLATVGLFGVVFGLHQAEQSAEQSRRLSEASRQNVERLVREIRAEGRRLLPADFQVRVYATSTPKYGWARNVAPPLHVKASLGTGQIWFELVDLGPGADAYRRADRGGGAGSAVRFAAHNLTAMGLEAYPFLESLNGVTFECILPVIFMLDIERDWKLELELTIRGRLFVGHADTNGAVKMQIAGL